MTQDNKVTPATPVTAYSEMSQAGEWDMLTALRGGTKAMRAAGEKYLPRETLEERGTYDNRLKRSFLLNAYDDAITKLSSRPFSRMITLSGLSDDRLSKIQWDVDRDKNLDLTQFARQVMDTGVDRGLFHVLVDYPDTTAVSSLAEERAKNVRPYFIQIHPDDLIGWEVSNETKELLAIRYKFTELEQVNEFHDKKVQKVRRYSKDVVQQWRYDEDAKDWVRDGDDKINTLGRVPLVTGYFDKQGFMQATPPLLNLAWLNVAHWQSYSDHRNILRFSRFGLLFGSGFTDEDKAGMAIGPNRLLTSQNPDARLMYVEHTGRAIKVGEDDLKQLHADMEVMAMQPLMSRPGSRTATEKAIDEAKGQSTLQSWVRSLEATLEQAYELAALWVRAKLPEDFSVDIFNEFGLSARQEIDLNMLSTMRKGRDITQTTYLTEIKRRGVLRDEFDIEAEVIQTEREQAELLSQMGMGLEDDDDDEESERNADGQADTTRRGSGGIPAERGDGDTPDS